EQGTYRIWGTAPTRLTTRKWARDSCGTGFPPTRAVARISLAGAGRGTIGVLLRGHPDTMVESYSIDTRTLKVGELFFALVGPNDDAHGFVPVAIRQGAIAVLISRCRAVDFADEAEFLRVADTNYALHDLDQ